MIRLSVVDHGHAPNEAAFLQEARERSGREPFGERELFAGFTSLLDQCLF